MAEHPTICEIVEFNLNSIPPDRLVSVSLRDLLFIHQTLGELIRFFHQPLHYPNLDAVKDFLKGSGEKGGFDVLRESYYKKMSTMLPPDILETIDEGNFHHPKNPTYFNGGSA